MAWFRLRFQVSQSQTDAAEALLERLEAVSVTLTDAGADPILEPDPGSTPRWDQCWVEALFALPADFEQIRAQVLNAELGLRDLQADFLEDSDWINHWRQFAVEFCFAGRLWIVPKDAPLPAGAQDAVVLRLDPGLAFGSGSHPTTRLCLDWLARQSLQGQSMLDFGCGSGVLAIAGSLLGASRVVAIDHDPQALLATRENAAYNGVAETSLAVGTAAILPAETGDDSANESAFDLVVANILAAPLIELAPRIVRLLKPGARLVLSGLLLEQAALVSAAYPELKFAAPAIEEDQQGASWVRLEGRRPGLAGSAVAGRH
jgi:ribosomal protein L11 methyltransferase